MTDELRFSLPGDEGGLIELWARVFGDSREYIEGFFKRLYTPGSAAVYLHGGRIVSAAYVLRLGDLVADGRWTPCRAVYAYGTDPDERGKGFGGKVLRAACDSAVRSGPAVICPAEPPLFGYYEKFGFNRFFSASVKEWRDGGEQLSGSVSRVTVRGYAALREELLHGRPHIDFDIKLLEHQEALCAASGGGLWYVVADGARCCAASEGDGDRALIKELIAPAGSERSAAALVARAMRAESIVCRCPVRPGEEGTPFAMISSPVPSGSGAWFGFAFD